MLDHFVFGRFVYPPGTPDRGARRRTQCGHHPRRGRRLMSTVAVLTCGSATLSCGLAALASAPAASLLQS